LPEEHVPSASKARRSPHLIAYYCGAAVLVVGVVSAALVYIFADDGDVDLEAELANARMYQHNLEVVGGKFAVYLDEFNRWFASLWHGRTLAYTIAVLAIVVAAACIRVGDLMSRTRDDS
jgi:hypothetical protein